MRSWVLFIVPLAREILARFLARQLAPANLKMMHEDRIHHDASRSCPILSTSSGPTNFHISFESRKMRHLLVWPSAQISSSIRNSSNNLKPVQQMTSRLKLSPTFPNQMIRIMGISSIPSSLQGVQGSQMSMGSRIQHALPALNGKSLGSADKFGPHCNKSCNCLKKGSPPLRTRRSTWL